LIEEASALNISTERLDQSYVISGSSRSGRDRMVLGITTIDAIGAYHHWCCEFESRSGWGVQHYVIKFVSDLRRYITEILFKVALNTNKQTKPVPVG